MPEQIPEQIASRNIQKEPPEIRRLFSRVDGLAELTSVKLEFKGMKISKELMKKQVLPILDGILENPEIRNNPKLIIAIEKHLHDFFARLGTLDSDKLWMYQEQKYIFEDLKYRKTYDDAQKRELALKDIIQDGFKSSFVPQMELMNRAFQRRALQYDYANFAAYQSALGKIDTFLPDDTSILDFILEKGSHVKNLSQSQKLKEEGMVYIIDTLNPPGALWLKQMAKNGNITKNTRVKGYTDAQVNGKIVDVVALLLFFRGRTQNFQTQEKEINMIRSLVFSDDKNTYLPRESTVFPNLAPTQEMSEQGLFDAVEKCNSGEDALRLFGKIAGMILTAEYFVHGMSGITQNGVLLNPSERFSEVLKGGTKVALLTLLFAKIFKFVGMGVWKIGKPALLKLGQWCKKYMPNSGFSSKFEKLSNP